MVASTTENLVVRLNPPEFWSATRLMSEMERDVLLKAITKLAEAGDIDGLSRFSFVTVSFRPAPQAA
jgi:hypothetical protein